MRRIFDNLVGVLFRKIKQRPRAGDPFPLDVRGLLQQHQASGAFPDVCVCVGKSSPQDMKGLLVTSWQVNLCVSFKELCDFRDWYKQNIDAVFELFDFDKAGDMDSDAGCVVDCYVEPESVEWKHVHRNTKKKVPGDVLLSFTVSTADAAHGKRAYEQASHVVSSFGRTMKGCVSKEAREGYCKGCRERVSKAFVNSRLYGWRAKTAQTVASTKSHMESTVNSACSASRNALQAAYKKTLDHSRGFLSILLRGKNFWRKKKVPDDVILLEDASQKNSDPNPNMRDASRAAEVPEDAIEEPSRTEQSASEASGEAVTSSKNTPDASTK